MVWGQVIMIFEPLNGEKKKGKAFQQILHLCVNVNYAEVGL